MAIKGRIDNTGGLLLGRPRKPLAGVDMWTALLCCYSENARPCGDWCPHFAEPILLKGVVVEIRLCQGTKIGFLWNDFSDERTGAGDV
jgi:hypothetical protein